MSSNPAFDTGLNGNFRFLLCYIIRRMHTLYIPQNQLSVYYLRCLQFHLRGIYNHMKY